MDTIEKELKASFVGQPPTNINAPNHINTAARRKCCKAALLGLVVALLVVAFTVSTTLLSHWRHVNPVVGPAVEVEQMDDHFYGANPPLLYEHICTAVPVTSDTRAFQQDFRLVIVLLTILLCTLWSWRGLSFLVCGSMALYPIQLGQYWSRSRRNPDGDCCPCYRRYSMGSEVQRSCRSLSSSAPALADRNLTTRSADKSVPS
jgi:hypothetical protein